MKAYRIQFIDTEGNDTFSKYFKSLAGALMYLSEAERVIKHETKIAPFFDLKDFYEVRYIVGSDNISSFCFQRNYAIEDYSIPKHIKQIEIN